MKGSDPLPVRLWKRGPAPTAVVVVLHDDHGRDGEAISAAAELFDRAGVWTAAPDFFRGARPTDEEEAHVLERGLTEADAVAAVRAVVDAVLREAVAGETTEPLGHKGGRASAPAPAVVLLGFGVGGTYALETALVDGRIRAAGVCWGKVFTDPKRARPRAEGVGVPAIVGLFLERDLGTDPALVGQFLTAATRGGGRVAGLQLLADLKRSPFREPVPGTGRVLTSWRGYGPAEWLAAEVLRLSGVARATTGATTPPAMPSAR